MPVEDGLDALAKEILASGRTYPVFDLAKLVLGARERFNVGFKCAGDTKLYRCRKDGSVWLNKDEAMQGFWNGQWRKEFYEQVISSADPPKGNFQTVAKCGFSGEYLGPPNYHGYQPAILQMHRERFANMSLEAYKRRIQMERSEEAVNGWMEQMSKRVQYRPTGGKAPEAEPKEKSADVAEEATDAAKAVEEAPVAAVDETASAEAPAAEAAAAEDGAAEAPAPEAVTEEAVTEAAPEVAEETPETETAETPEPEESVAAEEAPAAEPPAKDEVLLDDLQAVERHFLEHHFAEVFHHTPKAWVPGGVPGNELSPGLLTLLRQTVAEERRYPGRLTPMLCRQLTGRHVAVFKWRKKLKAGPARPHAVPTDIVLADRPQQLLVWLKDNSGKNLEQLWKDLLPKAVDDTTKHAWYHDLHWVLNQGYALLTSDSALHVARTGEKEDGEKKPGGKKQGRKKEGGKKPEPKKAEGKKPDVEKPETEKADSKKPEPEKSKPEEAETPKAEVEKPVSGGEEVEKAPNSGVEPPSGETPEAEVVPTQVAEPESPKAPAEEEKEG